MFEQSLQLGEWTTSKVDIDVFKKWVDEASAATNRKLVELIFKKCKFFDHCNAIRKYLLLG